MNCDVARELLGAFVDGEASPDTVREIEAHLAACPACAREMAAIRNLAARLSPRGPAPAAPPQLWSAIERRLVEPVADRRSRSYAATMRRPLAIAASLLLVVGLGAVVMFWGDGANQARAAAIDFSALLDALPVGPENAFQRFLAQNAGRPVSIDEARRVGAKLDFDVPGTLPGGFQRRELFALRFGDHDGIAATYACGDEFLAAIFHPPVKAEDFGTHKDYPCAIGKHRGHMVAVGEWKLVHLTDPTTCHCVLSRLDEERELPAVMSAVAPRSRGGGDHQAHDHHAP